MKLNLSIIICSAILIGGCVSKSDIEKKVVEAIENDPTIIIKAIEKKPVEFVEAFQRAIKIAQVELRKKKNDDERKKMEGYYEKPLKPEIRKDEAIRGGKDGVIELVMYSDFECPYCIKGYATVQELLKKYGKKMKYIYKHLPLDFHRSADVSARYYEAIRVQSHKKAFKFHDLVYSNQRGLSSNGEKFLKKMAKKVGANMKKLLKDIETDAIKKRVKDDEAEAHKFGMQGTPGFLLNGIPIKGAYPIDHFEKIISELQKRGKIKL